MSLTQQRRGRSVELTPAQQRAAAEAAVIARDFPLLPTAGDDATPVVADEPGDNLTPAQRLAVAAIVSGETFAAAARAASCTRRTLYAWRQEPAFRAAVEGRSREALDVVVVRVRNLMLRATRVLGDAMLEMPRSDGPRHAIRVLNSSRLWSVMREPAEEAGEPAAVEVASCDVADAVEHGTAQPA